MMKTLKATDFIIQTIMILVVVLITLNKGQIFMYGYFIIAVWQFLSMVVHQLNMWYTRKGSRRYNYHCFSVIAMISVITAYFIPMLSVLWSIMLSAAPLMAFYYLAICYREVFHPAKRPLELI